MNIDTDEIVAIRNFLGRAGVTPETE